jgi:hypothetical protein
MKKLEKALRDKGVRIPPLPVDPMKSAPAVVKVSRPSHTKAVGKQYPAQLKKNTFHTSLNDLEDIVNEVVGDGEDAPLMDQVYRRGKELAMAGGSDALMVYMADGREEEGSVSSELDEKGAEDRE